jgi:branched-chain amino acid transport system permease protein
MDGVGLLVQQVVSGAAAGSLYALMALGLVLLFRGTGIANFAHGEMAMVCAFVTLTLVGLVKAPLVVAFLVSIVFSVVLGLGIDRLAIRPLGQSPIISVVMATLALNILFHQAAFHVWGGDTFAFPSFFGTAPIHAGAIVVSREHVGIILAVLVIMAALYAFFRYTMQGLAMRAVAQDSTMSMLLGVPVTRVQALTWALSASVAAVAGNLFAPVISLFVDYMEVFTIKAFVVAVLGGLNSVPGAVVAGLGLGIVENLVAGYLSSEFRDALSLVLVVLVMLVRPAGLLGRAHVRKV